VYFKDPYPKKCLYYTTIEYISGGMRLENSKGIYMKNGFTIYVQPHK